MEWDEALKAKAKNQASKICNKEGVEESIGNHHSPRNERTVYIARYISPGKTMRYEKIVVRNLFLCDRESLKTTIKLP